MVQLHAHTRATVTRMPEDPLAISQSHLQTYRRTSSCYEAAAEICRLWRSEPL